MTARSIYDHPLYYDILFGWERDAEAARYASIFEACGAAPGGRVLDVGCGTGQVALRLAAAGWRVTGLDRSPAMLTFLRERAADEGLTVDTLEADMTNFRVAAGRGPFAAACCALNTVGLLTDAVAVERHLRAMGAALAPGAPYVLDVTAGAETGPEPIADRWDYQRDGVTVRAEGDAILVADPSLDAVLRLTWGPANWEYAPDDWGRMIAASGAFAMEAVYPESGRDEHGVSVFAEQPATQLRPGRSLLVLRRV